MKQDLEQPTPSTSGTLWTQGSGVLVGLLPGGPRPPLDALNVVLDPGGLTHQRLYHWLPWPWVWWRMARPAERWLAACGGILVLSGNGGFSWRVGEPTADEADRLVAAFDVEARDGTVTLIDAIGLFSRRMAMGLAIAGPAATVSWIAPASDEVFARIVVSPRASTSPPDRRIVRVPGWEPRVGGVALVKRYGGVDMFVVGASQFLGPVKYLGPRPPPAREPPMVRVRIVDRTPDGIWIVEQEPS